MKFHDSEEDFASPFRIGEKVAFRDEDVKGVVKRIHRDVIVVETTDGFEYKCSPREIVSQEIASEALSAFIPDKDWDFVSHDKYNVKRRATPPTNKAQRVVPARVLDLHIEKLVKSTRGMTSGDMLEYQLRYARTAIDAARAERHRRLIFIHGVGDGVLKDELIHMLKGYPRCRYFDAPFHLYGEGATEVEFY